MLIERRVFMEKDFKRGGNIGILHSGEIRYCERL